MKRMSHLPGLLVIITLLLSPAGAAAGRPVSTGAMPALAPVGAGFTYHGQLTKAGNPVNAACNFRFGLWDALEDGSRIGEVQSVDGVAVSNGLFMVVLNAGNQFGPNAFNGDARWLEIEVQCDGDPGFTLLQPRQPLTSTPYAVYAQIIPLPYNRQVNFTNPANGFTGRGAGLTDLNASNLASGIVPSDVISGTYGNPLDFSNPANNLAGDGAGLTGLNASNLISGTVPGGRLGGTYPNGVTFSNASNIFAGSGAGLTNLDASNLVSGTLISGVLAGEYSNALTLSNGSNVLAGDGAGLANVDADTLDGLDSTAFQGQGFVRTVRVSPVPGDPTASGTALLNALAGIGDNSASNPYLLKIEPGIYDLGNSALMMKPYVDVEGSGELVTTITATGSLAPNTGTVVGANDAELRFLTVENTGLGTNSIAIYNSSASPRLTHVTASASTAANVYGVFNSSASPAMTNVTAMAADGGTNYGVYNDDSSPAMMNVTATASGFDENYGVYNSNSSPVMTEVSATASGGDANFGVYNNASSPAMTGGKASATGSISAGLNYGVYNINASSVVMIHVYVMASGTSDGYGVYNDSSLLTLRYTTVLVSPAPVSAGLVNTGNGEVTIDNSSITSGDSTIYAGFGTTTQVGASQLAGAAILGSGAVTCIGVYDEAYASPGYTTCP